MPDEASNKPAGGPETDAANSLRLGPFRVSAAHAEIEAFCRETGWPEIKAPAPGKSHSQAPHNGVPHTFPMRWLAAPELRSFLEAKLKSAGGVAVHESQSFTYENPLEADQDYLMTAEVDQQENPQRLILRALVVTPRDKPCLQMETILRIVSAAGSAS